MTALSTFPIGSTSGGFSYETDPKTGIESRNSKGFGPAFSERALTIGRGKFSLGVNFQSVQYTRFQDLDLGNLRFVLQHNDCCNSSPAVVDKGQSPLAPAFESDLLLMSAALNVKADTSSLVANYGVTDYLDVGVALPFVRVRVDASTNAFIDRLSNTSIAYPGVHTFVANQNQPNQFRQDGGEKTGLGDVAARLKYRLLPKRGGGLALTADVRMPTGDKANLLGTGATQAKFAFVYSGEYGWFGPHASLGSTRSWGSLSVQPPGPVEVADGTKVNFNPAAVSAGSFTTDIPNEINYTGGLSVFPTPRFTVSFEAIGRTVRAQPRFVLDPAGPFQYRAASSDPVSTTTRPTIVSSGTLDLTTVVGIAGFKLNIAGNLLLSANVLFPLNNGGLRVKAAPVVGLDYVW